MPPHQWDLAQRHSRAQAIAHYPHQHRDAFATAVALVDLGVSLAADQYVGCVDHTARHVGVDVELRQDRYAVPDQPTYRGQDVAVGVLYPLRHHRAVQLQQHAVDGSGRADALQQLAENCVEDVAWRGPAGLSVGEQRGHQLEAFLLGAVEEAASGGVGPAELVQHLAAT